MTSSLPPCIWQRGKGGGTSSSGLRRSWPPRRLANRLIYLQVRTPLGKEKRPLNRFQPAGGLFVDLMLSGYDLTILGPRATSHIARNSVPHSGQSSVRQAKLGVSDGVQVPN